MYQESAGTAALCKTFFNFIVCPWMSIEAANRLSKTSALAHSLEQVGKCVLLCVMCYPGIREREEA